jgi:TonB-linked SusC/RagA family outer membrane protein
MINRLCRLVAALAFTGAPAVVGAQQTTAIIEGRVTDRDSHQPVPAAQVTIVGTGLGAVTNEAGQYTIRGVPAGTVNVRARRLGYAVVTQPVTVSAGDRATLDFALTAAESRLEEVVITATGETQRKRENGASIGVLSVDSVPLAANNSAADVLSSRVPGVTVDQPNGTAGGANRIRIRGSNSISLSNDPLVIIDGIRVAGNASASGGSDSPGIYTGTDGPSRLNDIDPNDIADIQVIKGPAAAALYGTAAANGVIQITTKRGQQGKARFDAFVEEGSVHMATDFPANYAQIGTTAGGIRITNCDIVLQGAGACTPIADSLVSWNPLEQASPFIVGNRRSYGLNVSGGTTAMTYALGGSYQREQGIYESNRLRNVQAHTNLHSQLRDNLDVTLSGTYVDGHVTRPQDGDNLGSIVSDGLFGTAFDDAKRGYLFVTPEKSQQIQTSQDINRFMGSVSGNYLPVHWLTLTGVGGVDYVNQLDAQFVPPGVFDPLTEDPNLAQGQRTLSPNQIFNYTVNASATARYPLRWIGGALATSTVGVQYNRSRTMGSRAFGQSLAPGTRSLNGANAQFAVDELNVGLATLGYLVQQQLTWNDRVYLTGAVRTDRTSAFGTNFKHVYYPAASLSWVIGDEPFFPKTDVISSLRVRAAYGTSGQNPQFRQAITYYVPRSVAFRGTDVPGVTVGGTGNANLKPETSKEFEVGLDAGLFHERLNAEFTFYNKVTDDAIVAQNLPPSLGAAPNRYVNVGKVRNSGIELLVNARLLDTRPVRIDLTLNGTTVHNKVVTLGEGIAPIIGAFQRVQAGYALGAFFDQPITSFSDANGNGVIDPDEITLADSAVFIGNPFATRTLSIMPTITLFKNVRVSALVDYRGGQTVLDYNNGARCAFFDNCQAIQDRSAPLADQANAVAASTFGVFGGYMEDASFTKLREVAVTWSIPATVSRRVGVSGLSLTLAGRNLYTWTKYKGLDPETNIQTTGYTVLDLESTPPARYYTARLNVNW